MLVDINNRGHVGVGPHETHQSLRLRSQQLGLWIGTGAMPLEQSGSGANTALGGAALSPSERYEFQILLSEANLAFEITAEAAGLQRSDSDCLFYSVNQFGQRNVQYPHSQTCWD